MNSHEVFKGLEIVTKGTKIQSIDVIDPKMISILLAAAAPKIFICNTTHDSSVVGHWICFTSFDNKMYEIFDSLADPLYNYNDRFKKIKHYSQNCIPLQHVNSSNCGKFCIMYAYYKARYIPFCQFQSLFSVNRMMNDVVVNTFYNVHVVPFM